MGTWRINESLTSQSRRTAHLNGKKADNVNDTDLQPCKPEECLEAAI
jgi:hypothetical protein